MIDPEFEHGLSPEYVERLIQMYGQAFAALDKDADKR